MRPPEILGIGSRWKAHATQAVEYGPAAALGRALLFHLKAVSHHETKPARGRASVLTRTG